MLANDRQLPPQSLFADNDHAPHRLFLRLVPILLAAGVYLGKPLVTREFRPPGRFVQLADAFLHGRVSIPHEPRLANELIPTSQTGNFYCPYPPLPAALLMPFVALFGAGVKVETACRWISILAVAVFGACLPRLPTLLGRPQLLPVTRAALTLLFALGTVVWHNADMGGDWHLAHATALAAMLLALREFLGRNRPLLVGVCIGLAACARPTAALTGVFFLLSYARRADAPAALLRFAAAPIIALALLAAYNAARFGNPFDFGYDRMILDEPGTRLLRQHGQFNIHFIPINAFWFFLAPPWPPARAGHGLLGFDPRGMSLLLTSPAMIYALVVLRSIKTNAIIRRAAFSAALCLIPLLMYFNSGYFQFGHRFAMDYLPMLMILLVAGLPRRPGRLMPALIAASIAINAWGICFARTAHIPI